tara:strand:- start:110 stop:400 length:291 start_codon:yes stop_codon:yes gene_type:complete
MKTSLEKCLEEALDNIRKDREVTKELLNDAIAYLAKDDGRHKEIGVILAKYVETLQRSNEQLVKVAALKQKKEGASVGLTEHDKSELFDIIKGGSE